MAKNDSAFSDKLDSFFNKINELSNIQRVSIFVATLVIVVIIYAWFLYLPKNKEIQRLEAEDRNLVSQVANARKKVAILNDLKKELENRKEEYFMVMKALPDTKEIPKILASISASAKESGLELTNISPGRETPKDFYAEIPISMQIKGGFHQTALFFDKVSMFGRIVSIESASIKSGENGSILTKCNAVTYRFLKDNKKKK